MTSLTQNEYSMVMHLFRAAPGYLLRDDLIKKIWPGGLPADPHSSLGQLIYRARKKDIIIDNQRERGYVLLQVPKSLMSQLQQDEPPNTHKCPKCGHVYAN